MADKRIQDLTAAGAVALTDLFEISQGGVASRKATGTQIQAAMTGKQDALPVADTTAIVKGSVDGTKQLRFEVDGFTAGATRIATPPNQDFTIAGINVAQTFTSSQTFTPATNTLALNVTGVSTTAASSQSFARIVGTWNTSGTPSAFLISITDSASNAASKIIDCQVGGSPVFSIGKTGSLSFVDDVRQTFNPGANASGLNVGSVAGDPGTLVDGDIWYESGANELHARINGATVALGAGGGSSPPFVDTTAIVKGSADATKLLRFEVDGFTPGATRVATPPDANFTMAGLEIANIFTAKQRIIPPANTTGLAVDGFSLTGANNQTLVDVSGTWNTSGIPTAFKLTISDTASNAASLLMDLIVGASSKASISKSGAGTFAGLLTSVGLDSSGGITVGSVFAIGTNGAMTIAPAANTTPFSISGFSLTGVAGNSMIGLSGTWNTSGAPTALLMNIVDTASDAASMLFDFKIGGVSKGSLSKSGVLSIFADFNAASGNFAVAADGSFQAAGGPFAVDASSNLTINSTLTFNSSGFTITDDGSRLTISTNIAINSTIHFLLSDQEITDDGTRLAFSGGIQIGTATLDDVGGGALESNTFKALTALQAGTIQLTDDSGDYLQISSGDSIRFGIDAVPETVIADSTILVKDGAGNTLKLLCAAV